MAKDPPKGVEAGAASSISSASATVSLPSLDTSATKLAPAASSPPLASPPPPGQPSFDAATHPRRFTYFLPSSLAASSTLNPIRAIVDRIVLPTHPPSKPLIPLSIGDPTTFGNLDIPENLLTSMISNLHSKRYNGYGPSAGTLSARQAIAERYSYPSRHTPSTASLPPTILTPADVLITSGCSGALSIAIEALCNPGSSLLIPRPGFPLYRTILGRNGIEGRYYDLLPEQRWEVDLVQLESLIDDTTCAILINNPSNPTGANWSREHIEALLEVAYRHRLPIIADEVYGDMVFEGEEYWPLAALSTNVPIISVGGIAKQFVCPGWRLGWILIYQKGADMTGWREGMSSMSQLIIGANTLVQASLPDLLLHTPPSYHQGLMKALHASARYLYEELNRIPALSCTLPQGAMYVMVRVDAGKLTGVKDEVEFAQLLLKEENVFALPGSCFQAPGFVRLVCCAPLDVMRVAVERMRAFCARHSDSPVEGAADAGGVKGGGKNTADEESKEERKG